MDEPKIYYKSTSGADANYMEDAMKRFGLFYRIHSEGQLLVTRGTNGLIIYPEDPTANISKIERLDLSKLPDDYKDYLCQMSDFVFESDYPEVNIEIFKPCGEETYKNRRRYSILTNRPSKERH